MSNDADAKLLIGADTAQLDRALAQAQQSVKDFGSRAESALGGVGNAAQRLARDFQGMQGSIVGSVTSMLNPLTKMAALIGGGLGLGKFVTDAKEVIGQSVQLGKVLGTSATDASYLRDALQEVGISTEEYVGASGKLTRQLANGSDVFDRYGIATRDSSGHLLATNDIMLNTLDALNKIAPGQQRNIALQQLFGKGAAEAAVMLKLHRDALVEAQARAEKYGTVVGEDDVEAFNKNKAATRDMAEGFKGLGMAIGTAVLPLLTDLSSFMAEVLPGAIFETKVAFAGLMTVVDLVSAGIKMLWADIKALIVTLTVGVATMVEVVAKLKSGDWAGAKRAGQLAAQDIADAWKQAGIDILKAVDDTGTQIKKRWDFGPKKAAKAPKGGIDAPADTDDGGKAKSRVGEWEAQLREAEVGVAEMAAAEGKFYQASIAMEIEYWRGRLAQTKKGTEENVAVRTKINELEKKALQDRFEAEQAALRAGEEAARNNLAAKLAYAKQEQVIAEQMYGAESKQATQAAAHVAQIQAQQIAQARQIADLQLEAQRQADVAKIDSQERTAKAAYDAHKVNLNQLIALQQAYENQREAIRLKAAQDALAELDPQSDPVEYQKRLNAIEQIKIQHDAKMQELSIQAANAEAAPWNRVFSSIGSGFDSIVKGMLRGTMSLSQAFATMAQSILSSMIDIFGKIAAKWALTEAMQLAGVTTTKVATVSSAASEAGANAVASTAAAPWPINLSAPAVGAEMAAAALSFSAAGGFDIPSNINPVTQLHAREMVLPAHIADPLRESLAGGGQGGDTHVHIHAVDAGSFRRMLDSNRGAFMDMIKSASRNFAT